MRSSRILWLFLLTLCLTGFSRGTLFVTAGGYDPPDPPHATHLTAARGPHIGTECDPCPTCERCHTASPPAWDNVDTGVCATCHTTGGLYDGVNNLTVGALYNWDNMGSSDPAAESLVYNPDGTLKSGKEDWCASCHDQTETGTAIIDDFESPLAGWGSSGDVNPDKSDISPYWSSESSSGMELGIKGDYLNVWLEWTRTAECNGAVWKNLTPAVDFSNRDTFNFYLKFSDYSTMYVSVDGIIGAKVMLRKAGTAEYTTTQFFINYTPDPAPYIKINDFVDRVWKLVSLPRETFTDPDWGMVDQVAFQFYEEVCAGDYAVIVHLDEIGCDITGANVMGDGETWGCSTTGHPYCAWCHDSTKEHVDYNRLTIWEYIYADTRTPDEYDEHNNPTNFRFYDGVDMQMRLALHDCDELANDYALCYQCHREEWVRGDIQGQIDAGEPHTNFYNEYGQNIHEYHMPCTTTPASRLSCVSCHDPHGQSSMAMMRDGMGGMVSLDADEYPCKIEYGADVDGDGKMDWHDPDINKGGAQTRRGGGTTVSETPYLGVFCVNCHGWPQEADENDCFTYPYDCPSSACHYTYYLREYAYVPHSDEMNCFDAGCHTVSPMHAAHFVSASGPGFELNENGCDECHASGLLQCDVGPVFADYQLFDDTNECLGCHYAAPELP